MRRELNVRKLPLSPTRAPGLIAETHVQNRIPLMWIVLLATFIVAACSALDSRGDLDPDAYRDLVEAAQGSGLTVYWVGSDIRVGAAHFDAIEAYSIRDGDSSFASGVYLHYFETIEPGHGRFDVYTFTARNGHPLVSAG